MDEKVDAQGIEIDPPTGALGSVARAVADANGIAEVVTALHAVMHSSLNKGEFAASMFEKLSANELVACPKYISDALTWLQKELDPGKEGTA